MAALLIVSTAGAASPAAEKREYASRIQGAWVREPLQCSEVFSRQGTSINFVRPGLSKREGVLVDEVRIRDGQNRCTIERVGADRDGYDLRLACFSGLAVAKTRFSVRVIDPNTIVWWLSSSRDQQVRLHRCRL